jgi:hypothetical protein
MSKQLKKRVYTIYAHHPGDISKGQQSYHITHPGCWLNKHELEYQINGLKAAGFVTICAIRTDES